MDNGGRRRARRVCQAPRNTDNSQLATIDFLLKYVEILDNGGGPVSAFGVNVSIGGPHERTDEGYLSGGYGCFDVCRWRPGFANVLFGTSDVYQRYRADPAALLPELSSSGFDCSNAAFDLLRRTAMGSSH